MTKISSKSLSVTFYCMLLMASKQKIKFGVFNACRINVMLRPDALKEYQAINQLADEKGATEEELKSSIEAMDNSYFQKFETIEKYLIKEIEPELIPYKLEDKEDFIGIFEVLSFLTDKGIIK